ncbi:MAG: ABC transporter permease [Labrys sp. (in: a-proteobacteria)]
MFRVLTGAAPWVVIGILVVPVLAGLIGTIAPALGYLPAAGLTTLSLTPMADLAATPGVWRAALVSLTTGLVSTALALLIAFLTVALFLDRPTFRVMRRLLSPLLAVPHAAAAFGLAALVAPSGWLVRLFSPWATGWDTPPDLLIVNDRAGIALTLGLAAKETPFLVLMLIAALPQAEASRRMLAAATLGYGRLKAFAVSAWPSLYAQIRLPVLAVIVYGTANLDMAMILGPTTPPTLSVMALREAADPDLARRSVAAAAAILQIGVCLLAALFWFAGERLAARLIGAAAASGRRARSDRFWRIAGALLTLFPPIAIIAGLATLALWSIALRWPFPQAFPSGVTLDGWGRTMMALAEPLGWTLALGAASSAIALGLVLLALDQEDAAGKRPGVAALVILYAPLLVPQIAFLLGLSSLAVALRVDGHFAAVLLAHLVFVLPYVYLSLAGPWRAFDGRYLLVARGLGAGRGRTFLAVRLPMLMRPIATAFALGFAVSVAQYLPTVLVGAGRITTVTSEAIALSAGQDRRVIGVVALIQALLPALAFALALALPAIAARRRAGLSAGEGA